MTDDKSDLVARIRDSMPLVVIGPVVTIGCDCAVVPVNYWHLPDGEWIEHTIVLGQESADAAEFAALGCVGFIIACPECGHVYVGGVT